MLQDVNIPIPDPITLNDVGAGDAPPAKRARVEVCAVSGTKIMGLPSGIVKCNIPICDLIKIVKPVIRQLVEDCKYFFF